MFIHCITGAQVYNPILACQDKKIRVLQNGEILYETATTAPVLGMEIFTKEKPLVAPKNS